MARLGSNLHNVSAAGTAAPPKEHSVDFEHSPKVRDLQARVGAFMQQHVYPAEARFETEMNAARAAGNAWQPAPVMEELKSRAKAEGLWNLFLPESQYGAGLTNLEYAPLAEIMGRSPIGAAPFNCSAAYQRGGPRTRKTWCGGADPQPPTCWAWGGGGGSTAASDRASR